MPFNYSPSENSKKYLIEKEDKSQFKNKEDGRGKVPLPLNVYF